MEICAVINLYLVHSHDRSESTAKTAKMTRDQSGRSKWSREQAQNSNAIDRFFWAANSLVISVVIPAEISREKQTASSLVACPLSRRSWGGTRDKPTERLRRRLAIR